MKELGNVKVIELDEVGGGVVKDLFANIAKKIYDNIMDRSTKANSKRSISLKIYFEPSEDRMNCMITGEVNANLASIRIKPKAAVLTDQGMMFDTES